MAVDKIDLIDALNANVDELRKGLDMHCGLVTSIMKGRLDEANLQPVLDRCPKRSREIRLEEAIKEAIDVLEESRKAFKSKALGVLRKKLTQVLIETDRGQ